MPGADEGEDLASSAHGRHSTPAIAPLPPPAAAEHQASLPTTPTSGPTQPPPADLGGFGGDAAAVGGGLVELLLGDPAPAPEPPATEDEGEGEGERGGEVAEEEGGGQEEQAVVEAAAVAAPAEAVAGAEVEAEVCAGGPDGAEQPQEAAPSAAAEAPAAAGGGGKVAWDSEGDGAGDLTAEDADEPPLSSHPHAAALLGELSSAMPGRSAQQAMMEDDDAPLSEAPLLPQGPDAYSRELTDVTVGSHVPLLDRVAAPPITVPPIPISSSSPQPPPLAAAAPPPPSPPRGASELGASDRGTPSLASPPPMRGDLPADLQEEVPGEMPTASPLAAAVVAPAMLPGRHPPTLAPPSPGSTLTSLGSLGSLPFAPAHRVLPTSPAGLGHRAFPKAEAFLGRPVDVARPPPELAGDDLAMARWLFARRRADAALQTLSSSPAQPGDSEVVLLRLRCLAATRRHQLVAEELRKLRASGARVPFEARLLEAQLPAMQTPADAMHALVLLQDLARQARLGDASGSGEGGHTSPGEQLQMLRVLSHVALAAGHGPVAAAEIRAAAALAEGDQDVASEFHALLGRHYAAGGDVAAATDAFHVASKCGRSQDTAAALLDRGLLTVARGETAAARCHFEAASTAATAALQQHAAGAPGARDLSLLLDEAVAAENNLAVCRLYAKELREGIRGLEAFVRRDPVLFFRQSVAQNLSALYEFLPDVKERRATLREVVDAYRLEDIDPRAIDQPAG